MFSIENGRDAFYQWDSEQRLVIEDASITEVHFCNRTDDCSLVCEVYKEDGLNLVNVPNILLQNDWDINVYGYNANYTKYAARFKVNGRTKPADYVYTETEVLQYSTLLKRINDAEENVGEVVENYLKENPIEVDLTGYATEDFVKEQIKAIDIPEPDLSKYALKSEIPDVSGFTTMAAVEGKGYQTATQVQAAISTSLAAIGVAEEGAY